MMDQKIVDSINKMRQDDVSTLIRLRRTYKKTSIYLGVGSKLLVSFSLIVNFVASRYETPILSVTAGVLNVTALTCAGLSSYFNKESTKSSSKLKEFIAVTWKLPEIPVVDLLDPSLLNPEHHVQIHVN